MSEANSYKDCNSLTFTFTQEEVHALAGAMLAGAVKISAQACSALREGDEGKANRLLDMGDVFMSAHEKLVRQ
ncbi:hypothetical protein GTP23_12050 [Pseudoduganella sp. FT93W]|uniref:Uncharacterized protein n=1 Tax=Duganella fentianensis TaxID=2692177 RepID=A0A845HXQ7_9BURK|nr:hypothetical protein [Duganella fentianensis]MYN45779.1 hypothetical protein [Duganella fentianensis]